MTIRIRSAVHPIIACLALSVYLLLTATTILAQDGDRSDDGAHDASAEVLTKLMHLGENGVLYTREESTRSWTPLTAGLPRHPVYPFDEPRPVRLSSVSRAPESHSRIVATSGTNVYIHDDDRWREVAQRSQFGTYAYLTAVAVSPLDRDRIVVGTSFHGIYMSTDGGSSWEDLSSAFGNLERGAHYFDDFTALAFGATGRTLYAAVRLGTELYAVDLDSRRRRRLSLPAEATRIGALSVTPDGKIEMRSSPDNGVYQLVSATGGAGNQAMQWRTVERGSLPADAIAADSDPASDARRAQAAERYGMYIPFLQARGERLEEHIDFAQQHGVNAFVIDFKDDEGRITYNSELDLPQEAGAVRNFIDIDALAKRLEEAGIYLIARQVVFKDAQLYRYDGGRLAIRDSRSGKPWGRRVERTNQETGESVTVQREHWVDPFSREVWDYNASIAAELQRRGVDEIQFDYIRFPSDGPVRHMQFSHRRSGMRRVDALASFLAMARERVDIPIGTDVFGFNAWYEMDYLGQNIAMIARHVDVISPMYYPSHFDSRFLGDRDFYRRARDIYRLGAARARVITGDRALIRPYVQSFLIGSELELERPEYSRYLTEQIQGSLSAGTRGFLLWNFSGRYYMVVDSLRPYTSIVEGGSSDLAGPSAEPDRRLD